MKVAIVHDQLMEFGGSERVVYALLKIFPQADLYTSTVDYKLLKYHFPSIRHDKIHTSWLQHFPQHFLTHTTILQSFAPLIWKYFDFEKYDLVISSSSYLLSNTIKVKKPIHIQYIHSPPKNLLGLSPTRLFQNIIPYSAYVSNIYKHAILSSKYIVTNSMWMQKLLYRLYKVKSEVMYPPVRIVDSKFRKHLKKEYFIVVSRIDRIKNLELAIVVCNKLKLQLKIIGKAMDKKYERFLKSIAGPTVEFLGEKTDHEVDFLYQKAKGFIFTSQYEDFGIAPVEAMAHGVPVIAYYGGGVKETIKHLSTGIFYFEHTTQSLCNALRLFNSVEFDSHFIRKQASRFSYSVFNQKFKKYVSAVIRSKLHNGLNSSIHPNHS